MSDVVTLTLRTPLDAVLDAECIAPDRFAQLGEREIATLPVWSSHHQAALGDFFDVRGSRSEHVRVVGALERVNGLGSEMHGGELLIDGDVGDRVATAMTGGSVDVRGRVGDDAGAAMTGGLLRITGDAGDRTGANTPGASRGMTGGEIIIGGSTGSDTGARMRRGLVVVVGSTSAYPARSIIAGTVLVLGRAGPHPGMLSKRGTLIAVGGADVPATYRYACTYHPPHLRLTMTYLRRRHALPIDNRIAHNPYRRYCGDAGDPGKGEILVWAEE